MTADYHTAKAHQFRGRQCITRVAVKYLFEKNLLYNVVIAELYLFIISRKLF